MGKKLSTLFRLNFWAVEVVMDDTDMRPICNVAPVWDLTKRCVLRLSHQRELVPIFLSMMQLFKTAVRREGGVLCIKLVLSVLQYNLHARGSQTKLSHVLHFKRQGFENAASAFGLCRWSANFGRLFFITVVVYFRIAHGGLG